MLACLSILLACCVIFCLITNHCDFYDICDFCDFCDFRDFRDFYDFYDFCDYCGFRDFCDLCDLTLYGKTFPVTRPVVNSFCSASLTAYFQTNFREKTQSNKVLRAGGPTPKSMFLAVTIASLFKRSAAPWKKQRTCPKEMTRFFESISCPFSKNFMLIEYG